MLLTLAQLSDIHFQEGRLLPPAASVARAIVAANPACRLCCIVLTGDLAYSGSEPEYAELIPYFALLRATLEEDLANAQVVLLAIPGNHDCDYHRSTKTRTQLIEAPPASLAYTTPEDEIVASCLEVQTGFLGFAHAVTEDIPHEPKNRLLYKRCFDVGDHRICFLLANTAWLSQLHDKQGSLFVPADLLKGVSDSMETTSLTVLAMHHPTNWLAAENKIALIPLIHGCADIVLTGHEHTEGSFSHTADLGSRVHHVEGALFSGIPGAPEEFNVFLVDLDLGQCRRKTLRWEPSLFRAHEDTGVIPFERNPTLPGRPLPLTAEFERELRDPGAGFTHPRRPNGVRLDEIFVPPELIVLEFGNTAAKPIETERMASSECLSFFESTSSLLVIGNEHSGKTTLAKQLFVYFRSEGLLPMLASGDSLRGLDEARFTNELPRLLRANYSPSAVDHFIQNDRRRKILIIDDFSRLTHRASTQRKLLAAAQANFARLIVFVDDLFVFDELLASPGNELISSRFVQCRLPEWGHRQRRRLIERWLSLGADSAITEPELAYLAHSTENVVNTLLGEHLLPFTPFTVLAILQAQEAQREPSAALGSYGYLYELLILQSLASAQLRQADVDVVLSAAGYLAFAAFEQKDQVFQHPLLDDVLERYFARHRVRIQRDQFLGWLVRARLIVPLASGHCFRYPYVYYYLLARHLRDRVQDPDEREGTERLLRTLADRLFADDYGNIVLFYLYLQRDIGLIRHLLSGAQGIFATYQPCELATDFEFLDDLAKHAKPLALPPEDTQANVDEHRGLLDSHESQSDREDTALMNASEGVVYSDALDGLTRLNIGFKTLRILGQVLRNFPGSLTATMKLDLLDGCYRLGLRTLSAIVILGRDNLEEIRSYYAAIIRDRRAVSSAQELRQLTDALLLALYRGCVFGVIKRVSNSVGLDQLRESYRELAQSQEGASSFQAIDLSIRLDHFAGLPEREIKALARVLHSRLFAFGVLQDLVWTRLYQLPAPYDARQRVAALVNLQGSDVRLLDNPAKKLPPQKA